MITIQTNDRITLSGLLSLGQSDTLIIHIPGMQADFFTGLDLFYEQYPIHGISFLAGENRGSYIAKNFSSGKGKQMIGGAYELFEDCIYDLEAWIQYAFDYGFRNIWLSSHSLSTAKVAYYMDQKKDPRVKGIILMSPSDTVGLVKDPEGARDHALCFPEAQSLINEGKPYQLLTHALWGDKILSAKTYLDLFSDESNANIFHYYDQSLNWEVVNSITVPVIAFTGTKDDGIYPVIKPGNAMKILRKELKSSPQVTTFVFENAEHSFCNFEMRIIDLVCKFIQRK